MHCENCGNAIPEGAAFCPSCGTKVVSAPQRRESQDEIVQGAVRPEEIEAAVFEEATVREPVRATSAPPRPRASVGSGSAVVSGAPPRPQAQGVRSASPYVTSRQSAEAKLQYAKERKSEETSSNANMFALIAFIFCCITLGYLAITVVLNLFGSSGFGLVGLVPCAWQIPMTVMVYQIWQGERPNTTGFDVCVLLFVNLVSGILLLVRGED